MTKCLMILAAVLVLLTGTNAAIAQTDYTADLLGTGHDEREDAPSPCLNDLDFTAGVYDAATQLQVGGDRGGCDSEWGTCAEFDFADIGLDNGVLAARLILRYTGYGDYASGLPYVGVYGYDYTGSAVILPRADLDDQTALAIFAPTSVTNVDIEVNVTDYIADLVDNEIFQAGFFVCGIFSEVGYDDMVYFGGADHTSPPRLVIETVNPVAAEAVSWGEVKTLFR